MGCKWNKIFDIYSPEYKLRFKGEKCYNSIFGELMGLASILIFISLFINFAIKLFSRKNFDIFNSYTLNNNFQINLTNIPFFLVIMDKDSNIIPYNESIYKFSFEYKKHIFKNNIQAEYFNMKYNLEECDYSYIKKEDLHLLNNYRINNLSAFKCFPKDIELILNGRLGKNYSSILLTISICGENNSNCENIEKIENILKEGIFIISYFSYSIDHNSYEYPVKKTFRTDIFSIPDRNLRKSYNYYFNGAKYESDNGIFFKKIKKIEFFEPNEISFDINLINNSSNNKDEDLITIELGSSEIYNIYYKEYKKIQYYLGLFNGCYQAIYIIFKLISNYILLKMSSRDIVNEIFFKETLNQKNKNFLFKKNINNTINRLNQKNINQIENEILSKHKLFSSENIRINNEIKINSFFNYENAIGSFYKKYFNPIIFNIKHYFLPNICLKNDKKIKILTELYQNINSKISIEILYFNENIIKKKA